MSLPVKRLRVKPEKAMLRVTDIPVKACVPNPDQPRKYFDESLLADLAASIERHGLLQPIIVISDSEPNRYIIVAGERRFRAFQLLAKKYIPAIITAGKTDEIALIENIQREALNPLEEAEALAQLKQKYAYTHEELGQVVGKAKSTISNLLKLTQLPESIKNDVSMSKLTNKSILIEVSKLKTKKDQLELWQRLKEQGATVRTVREHKKKRLTTGNNSKKPLEQAERLLRSLEAFTESQTLDTRSYETMLGLYKRFVVLMEKIAHSDLEK